MVDCWGAAQPAVGAWGGGTPQLLSFDLLNKADLPLTFLPPHEEKKASGSGDPEAAVLPAYHQLIWMIQVEGSLHDLLVIGCLSGRLLVLVQNSAGFVVRCPDRYQVTYLHGVMCLSCKLIWVSKRIRCVNKLT